MLLGHTDVLQKLSNAFYFPHYLLDGYEAKTPGHALKIHILQPHSNSNLGGRQRESIPPSPIQIDHIPYGLCQYGVLSAEMLLRSAVQLAFTDEAAT